MTARWIHALLVSTLVIAAGARDLRTADQPNHLPPPEEILNGGIDPRILRDANDYPATNQPLTGARFHQFPLSYYTNSALAALYGWKRPPTPTTTASTTTTEWDDWDD